MMKKLLLVIKMLVVLLANSYYKLSKKIQAYHNYSTVIKVLKKNDMTEKIKTVC